LRREVRVARPAGATFFGFVAALFSGVHAGGLILAIETSNPSAGGEAGVALVGPDGAAAGVARLRTVGRHDDDLMPAIDRLFRRVGVGPGSVGRVAVSIGPGGYTGLRVAVTTANVIGGVCGAEVVGVPTALALARRAGAPRPLAVCLAVKGASVWVHRFPEGGAGVEAIGDLAADGTLRGVVADRFLPGGARAARAGRGGVVEEPRYDPVAVAEASAGLAAGGAVALYAREPEAVTRWRERHG
jgi:tRNA threonylcarbamoyl adenosine modification protein YeaZ